MLSYRSGRNERVIVKKHESLYDINYYSIMGGCGAAYTKRTVARQKFFTNLQNIHIIPFQVRLRCLSLHRV